MSKKSLAVAVFGILLLAAIAAVWIVATNHAAAVKEAERKRAAEILQYKRDSLKTAQNMMVLQNMIALRMAIWRSTIADKLREAGEDYQGYVYNQLNKIWIESFDSQSSTNIGAGILPIEVEQQMKKFADPPIEVRSVHEALLKMYQSYRALEEYNRRPRDFLEWVKHVEELISEVSRSNEQVAVAVGDLPPEDKPSRNSETNDSSVPK